jgi:uncharacterized membrane protein
MKTYQIEIQDSALGLWSIGYAISGRWHDDDLLSGRARFERDRRPISPQVGSHLTGMAQQEVSPERLEAFSDGVIAIIVTIMVLELKLPEHVSERGLTNGLLIPMAPKLVSYAMSFLVVAIMWVNHHALMATVRDATRAILWHNNHLLFWMSLIPFATGFLGENPRLPDAYAVYGFVLAAAAAAFTLLRWHASVQGQDDQALVRVHRTVLSKSLLASVLYALAIPLAYLAMPAAIAIFVAIPVIFFLPIFAHPAPRDQK